MIPGGGQWLQEQRRSYLYAGLELVGWIAFAHGRHQGGAFRDEYRDLAWRSARLYQSGDRVVSDFRYYESLGSFASSGSWDRDPTAEGLQPENDPDTFNGSVWLLASQLFLSGEGAEGEPEAVRMALEYYQENAYPPELAWDWGGNTFQLERYRELIEKSDDSFRRATVVLGGIIANHILSAVDGFLSARISSTPRPSEGFPTAGSAVGRWTLELRLNSLP